MNKKTRKSQLPRAFRPRLLAVSTALIAGLPTLCSALGLGDIQYKSWLGEPLKAEIDLVNLPAGINRENLKFRQVDRAEAERLGVEIISNWHRFNFEVDTAKQNFQVQLHSQQPIKEPYLNILVELSWPQGTLYREYTVFLDPAPTVTQLAETSTATRQSTKTVADTPRAPQPAASQAVQGSDPGQERYRVASGDTLYGIARRVSATRGQNPNDLAAWLFSNNPEAFVEGDANRLIAGRSLRLPEGVEFARSARTATSVFNAGAEQNESQGRLILDQPVNVEGDDQLGLLAASAKGDLQQQLSSSRAVLDYLVKENRDLKDRLTYLESSEYLNTLKELVDLQKREITSLRAQLADIGDISAAVVPAAESVAVVEETAVLPTTTNNSDLLYASFTAGENPFVASQQNAHHFWTFLSSGFAAAMAVLFAFLLWRSRSKSLNSAPTPMRKEEENEAELPVFEYTGAKKEISLDDYVDINLALTQQASNDQLMHETIDSVEQAHNEISFSMRDVAEKVQQERNKVEYLQQRIREKTDEYNERKKQGIEEPKQVEEIEIDPELEQYLKF